MLKVLPVSDFEKSYVETRPLVWKHQEGGTVGGGSGGGNAESDRRKLEKRLSALTFGRQLLCRNFRNSPRGFTRRIVCEHQSKFTKQGPGGSNFGIRVRHSMVWHVGTSKLFGDGLAAWPLHIDRRLGCCGVR